MPSISLVKPKEKEIRIWKLRFKAPNILDAGYGIAVLGTILNPALGVITIPVLASYMIDKIISSKTKRGKWLSRFIKQLIKKDGTTIKASFIPGYYYALTLKPGMLVIKLPFRKKDIVIEAMPHNAHSYKIIIDPEKTEPEALAVKIYKELEEKQNK
ncbi:MAG: hypothetical protein GXO43_05985 [Crenarchaeota archaeon]|nr:hypothetical protein [Thermoproteota archaeon]